MRDEVHAALVRARLTGFDDGAGLQTITATGHKGTTFSGVLRAQPFGFSSTPPVGSVGLLLQQAGASDRAYALGFESPDHRPTGLAAGGTRLYDASGQVVSIVERTIRIVGGDLVHISATEIVLEGTVRLGSSGAAKAVAMLGSIDSAGDSEVSGLATKVYAE